MFNQLLKWTLLISIWRKYKQHIGITIVLVLALMLTSLLHQDFVNYSLASNNDSLGLSYVIKWVVYLVLVSGYWLSITKIKSIRDKDSDLHRKMKMTEEQSVKDSSNLTSENHPDPFANIRDKKSLRSEADMVIEKAAIEKAAIAKSNKSADKE